jgi:hypothetical protein
MKHGDIEGWVRNQFLKKSDADILNMACPIIYGFIEETNRTLSSNTPARSNISSYVSCS